MGLSDYWKSNRGRQDAAEQFLRTGRSPDESFFIFGASSNTDTSSSSQECFDSRDCASGWACNGGKCKQSDTGAGDDSYGDTSGCGGGDGGGGGGGGCGASTGSSTGSSSSGCTKSGCGGSNGGGGNGGGGDCCGGERCCRYNGSSVSCSCGNCPPPPGECSRFCTDYSAANGEPAPGCGGGNTCSECETCREDPETGIDKCLPRNGGPCYCPNSSCSGKCATCTEQGTCEDDCANCQTCYTTFKDCDCGTVKKTCCYSACDQTKGYTECRESIDCGELCGDPPGGGGGGDPCAGNCYTVTTCTPDEPPPCPPRSSCTGAGSISSGGQTCTLTTICDKSNVPDDCGFCDCNCENDCPDCYICNAEGKCVPDPECNKYYSGVVVFLYQTSSANQTGADGTPCFRSDISQDYSKVAYIYGNLADSNDLGVSYGWVKAETIAAPTIDPIYGTGTSCIPKLGFFQGPVQFYNVVRSDGSIVPSPLLSDGFRTRRFEGTYSTKAPFTGPVTTKKPGTTLAIFGFGNSIGEATQDRQAKEAELGYP